MEQLNIRLFGSFRVIMDDPHHYFALKTDKSRALFVFLLMENERPHRRAKLVDLFWPGFPDKAAHNSLRQSIYYIRSLSSGLPIGAFQLVTSNSDVQLIPQPGLFVDAFELSAALSRCELHHKPETALCDSCLDALIAAVHLYNADFMDSFSLRDAPQFDWWLLHKREMFNRQVLQALTWITNSLTAKREYGQATGFAQREVEVAPWCEPAHQRYMKVLALSGERGKALQHFAVCQKLLSNELGIEPSTETQCLCEQIRRGTILSAG